MTGIISLEDINSTYEPKKNITRNIMTKYEKAKIIGMRMEQLAREAMPMVDTHGCATIRDIAIRELDEKKLPFMVARTLANGKKEYWKLADLIVI